MKSAAEIEIGAAKIAEPGARMVGLVSGCINRQSGVTAEREPDRAKLGRSRGAIMECME